MDYISDSAAIEHMVSGSDRAASFIEDHEIMNEVTTPLYKLRIGLTPDSQGK